MAKRISPSEDLLLQHRSQAGLDEPGEAGFAPDRFEGDVAFRRARNHTPVANNDTNGKDRVIEDDRRGHGDPTAKGNVLSNDTDQDHDTLKVLKPGTFEGDFGTLKLSTDGKWTYRLDDSNPKVDALSDGDWLLDTFNYTATDGHGSKDGAVLKIKIEGRDDPPTASIELDAVTADNIVNASEASGKVNITGTVGGDVRDGDIVTVTINGTDYEGAVASGHFSIEVDGAQLAADADLKIEAKVTTGEAGNMATAYADKSYAVDVTPPAATIGLDSVTTDNVVNLAESKQALIIITGTVSGEVKTGESVTLVVNGQTFAGAVAADNTYAIGVSGADLVADTDRRIDASVTTTDDAGNSTTATFAKDYLVDIAPSKDFDGDLKSDVLFINTNGSVAMWQMDGSKITRNVTVGSVGTSWHALAAADFSGDALADVLFENDTGQVALWKMNGPTIVSNTTVGRLGTDWHLQGAGDFNGDGRADVLWRNNNNQVAMWELDGDKIIGNLTVGALGSSWHFGGVDDFNGDQMDDVLWFNDNGQVAMWQMNGNTITANTTVRQMDPGFAILTVGDFTGDGKADIVLRSSSGTIAMWQMNGDKVVANETVGSIGSDWTLLDTGDYNGDGHADILWRNTQGNVAIWEMDGSHIDANLTVGSLSNDWSTV